MPGGGIDFGEHPEAGALRELHEETGLVGRIVELLAVDSLADAACRTIAWLAEGTRSTTTASASCTAPRSIGGDLRDETDESTDLAAWFTHEDAATLPLVELGRIGVELAFGESRSAV